MSDIKFKIDGDFIVRYVPVLPDTYKTEVVMDKKTFVEAFEKWIGDKENKDV